LQVNDPIQPPEMHRFSISSQLSGPPFKPNFNSRIEFDNKGNLLLVPGERIKRFRKRLQKDSKSSMKNTIDLKSLYEKKELLIKGQRKLLQMKIVQLGNTPSRGEQRH
jgi:hypothetical protein